METVTFFFSFRSPFAWLAYHRVARAMAGFPVQFERVPVFPPPDFPNDPVAVPQKLQYVIADAERIATAYGLPVRWPTEVDIDWMPPHAAYVHAAEAGRGDAFALALYAARFSEGREIGSDAAIGAAAAAAELDAAATVRAAHDPAVQQRVLGGMMRALGEGIFGVPYFVYGTQRFWGNDRLDWVVRAVHERLGRPVPDLRASPFARPW